MKRQFSLMDTLIKTFDQGLRTILGINTATSKQSPAIGITEESLSEQNRKDITGLLRVDHVGEVCAQALYHGQALFARTKDIKEKLLQSAEEENDHLQWCQIRLRELGGHTSYLNPLWYIGSFCIGMTAAALGDKYSLGFLAETERQVVEHLDSHIQLLADTDKKSVAILQQMRSDELQHALNAMEYGAVELPYSIKSVMRIMSKAMTTTAYWV